VNYDDLYPSNYTKPSSYLRFSQTVEECISCQYDMTIEDNDFLKQYNSKPPAAGALSEDDFERIMEVFEDTAAEQTPFASVDNTVVGYDMMVPSLHQLGSASILQHAKPVYEYWKSRRQEMGNKPLHPTLKFETHQESDDTDPYVCFRRREARQTRKTRGRDTKVTETLKRLRRELEDGRQLVLLAYEREMTKRELLHMDRAVFEERARLKHVKTRLGIKDADDDLINQKVQPLIPHGHSTVSADSVSQPQKRKAAETPAVQRPSGQHMRMPVRPDGRTMDQDLILLSDKLAEKENELNADIEMKVQNHRKWNLNHIDLTRDPLSPVQEKGEELKFRPAKTQYLMTPPASSASDDMDVDEDAPEPMQLDKDPVVKDKMSSTPFKQTLPIVQFKAGGSGEFRGSQQPSFRRRIGRQGRLWIDRRGLASPPREDRRSDRWRYDSDSDDDEPPVYEIDPFDTRALKFRATIPLNPFIFGNRRPQPPPEHGGQQRPVPVPVPQLPASGQQHAAQAPQPQPQPQAQAAS
jgi:enhancer of polycomb-like protein